LLALSGDGGALAVLAGMVCQLWACSLLATALGLRDRPADHRPAPGAAAAAPARSPAAVASDHWRRRRPAARRRNTELGGLTPVSVAARGLLARSALAHGQGHARATPPPRARCRPGLGLSPAQARAKGLRPLDSPSARAGLYAPRPFLQAERKMFLSIAAGRVSWPRPLFSLPFVRVGFAFPDSFPLRFQILLCFGSLSLALTSPLSQGAKTGGAL
jgi:hypothetical protein